MFKRLFAALTILFIIFFAWYFQATRPVTNKQVSPVEFEIKPGWGVDRIGQELSQVQLIRSRTAFKITVVTLGISSKVQAGFFKLSQNMTITEIAKSLTRASVKTIKVTIPEGLRRQEIALILENSFKDIEGKTFSPDEFLIQTANKEGRLFPDTYDFDPKSNTSTIINRLETKYLNVLSEAKIPEESRSRVTIIASLLERESAQPSEMPEIAGVIENRLNKNWPLQIDATVQYAISSVRCKKIDCNWWTNNLTKEDLQVKSPYNTYLNQDLPPAPISNPGKSSILAAFSPQKTNAWFYLHDNQGKIHFANTIEEHNNNVCTYLRKDCPK